ncbi:PREDICTED: uncharacterized protein LOC108776330 isoform X2 [Cyphomyrmex costatus]|uniref:uncharacterized protein LOC108776330 isoform X2 n=1 Tax=Cyphomyrmex costatus TaxID=456900 RepID=UPI00085232A2|nr:PREDICTED: uncharacterized protein LOC108776330 isoform X2 [Cyphomyrmex costatus]
MFCVPGIVFSVARERNTGTKEGFHASRREIRPGGWGMAVTTTYDGIGADKSNPVGAFPYRATTGVLQPEKIRRKQELTIHMYITHMYTVHICTV